MLARKNGLPSVDDDGQDQQSIARLVWSKVSNWVWVTECGRFKIERFIADEGIRDHPWREGWRVLKHTPEWYFHADTQPTLAAAQAACEGMT